MKFLLKGSITFSKDAEDAEGDIARFIEEANKEILLKGVPEGEEDEGARIIDWKINENTMNLIIESGFRVRAHDGLLRIKKPLAEAIGKKYQMGIRKIHADTYIITIPTGESGWEIDNEKTVAITQISKVEFRDDETKIILEDISESNLRKQSVNRVLKHVTIKKDSNANVDTTSESNNEDLTFSVTKITPGEIIARSPEFESYFKGDTTEEAIKQGWIKEFPGRGQWFYGPEITALQRAFEELLIESIIEKLDFEECLFPKLIPIPTMDKMRYLDGLPEGMYYCCAPKRDSALFTRFKDELAITREVPMNLLKEGLKDPNYVLAAAQCEPFYEFFSHEVIDETELPVKFYDKSGWTYRWESGGAKGIDRVHEFQRIELVWLGTPEQVEKIRDATLELSHDLSTALELEWYTEIGDDPFYLEGRKVESRGIEFPDIPKYELRLKVPGRDKGVAVVSANVHGTHFVEGFSIKEAHKYKVWTGCTGLGLTRWLFGFLAQKGFNKENWPEKLKEKLKEVKTPKLLTRPRTE